MQEFVNLSVNFTGGKSMKKFTFYLLTLLIYSSSNCMEDRNTKNVKSPTLRDILNNEELRKAEVQNIKAQFEIAKNLYNTERISIQDPIFGELLINSFFLEECFDEFVELLKMGVNPNEKSNSILLYEACAEGNLKSLKALLKYNADPNIISPTLLEMPMHACIREGNVKFADLLLKKGANPNLKGPIGCSPLMFTCLQSKFQGLAKELKFNNIIDYISFDPYSLDQNEQLRIYLIAKLLEKGTNVDKNEIDQATKKGLNHVVDLLINFKPKKCNICKKTASFSNKLLLCGGCKKIFYCNKECQKKDWHKHKSICKKNN